MDVNSFQGDVDQIYVRHVAGSVAGALHAAHQRDSHRAPALPPAAACLAM